ncbi:conserved hypothetical protein [Acinetobacter proteolyticus]|uniref:Uncharacterized protein n=1 Tax=Acinetobacter proteolyticus TaxID=1776741 RepID=A0A653KCQ1_9GAMM|nr:hypothetical protein [Acinetobacter proteolyticus]VXA58279.1 conserved hypothetical protein [Acinetobacter proteolyticus]
MKYIYLKKDGKYLHIVQNEHEEYQDQSDISAVYSQQYVLKPDKDGAIKFQQQREVDYFLAKQGRKLKGFTQVKE